MRYVTINELNSIIRRNLWRIPHDIDLVVGVPRSGLLVANMIALFLNKRLTDIDSFTRGYVFECGERGKYVNQREIHKVLVVDDSVCYGSAITKAKTKIENLSEQYEFVFLSPIVSSLGKSLVDIYFEIIDEERVFEWNLFHHSILNNACFDIDGVLCCDPTEDDDGEIYMGFLRNANPLFTPTLPIDTLISCRLEKYRKQTEEWLFRNGVSYNRLVMLDFPDKASRLKWGKHGEFKGNYYKESGCRLFVESSYSQAYTIAKISNKPVICVETNELLTVTTILNKAKKILRTHIPKTYHFVKMIAGAENV